MRQLVFGMKQQVTLKLIGVTLVVIAFLYLLVFGRALEQQDDHLRIALHLPVAMCGDKVAQIDPSTYLARDSASMRAFMEASGYTHIEQLGAAHFYDKEGTRYLVTGHQYSSFFMVFGVFPEQVGK